MSDTPSRPLLLVAALLLVVAGIVAGLLVAGVQRSAAIFSGKGNTRIDQGMVLDRLRSVANLVTTEVALRDVVTYQNTRLGSTKRSLVVVTGKALVGFDLGRARARVDEPGKTIELTLPRARLIGVDILQLKTYDERGGLWNPFHPSDRDTIYQVARERLKSAAGELGVREHAEAGARSVLAALFAAEGYEVRVSFGTAATESMGRWGLTLPEIDAAGLLPHVHRRHPLERAQVDDVHRSRLRSNPLLSDERVPAVG